MAQKKKINRTADLPLPFKALAGPNFEPAVGRTLKATRKIGKIVVRLKKK